MKAHGLTAPHGRADSTVTDAPETRGDRSADVVRLPRPVILGTGAKRGTMVVATPGVLTYPWGAEYVPPETLQDGSYLDGFAGLPLLMDDPKAHRSDGGGVRVGDGAHESLRLGTVLRSWWDEGQEAQLAEYVLDTPQGLQAPRDGFTGVSPFYTVASSDLERGDGVAPDGVQYQATQKRRSNPNHVVLTRSPRGQGAQMRADSKDGRMDPTKLIAALATLGLAVEFGDDATEAHVASTVVDAARADAIRERDEAKAETATIKEERDDAVQRADADRTAHIRAHWRDVELAAKRVGAEVPGEGISLDGARKIVVAKALGQERADSATVDTLVDGIRLVLTLPGDAYDRAKAEVTDTTGRGDSADPFHSIDHPAEG